MKPLKLPLLALFLILNAGRAHCEENALHFKNTALPIMIPVAEDTAIGAVIYETQFSETPAKDYDTVLIDGEMPDTSVRLQVRVKNGATVKTYDGAVLHRFPNGRFWAKYKVGPLTREPLKIALINDGAQSAHTFTIYGAETFSEAFMKESPSAVTMPAYQPDPGFFLPEVMPFAVVRRATWKAAPPKEPYTPHAPKIFTLHHTQGNSPKNYEAAVQEMQFIQDYHQNGRGWIDIGYHFLISPQGDIFEGRPVNVVGAHVKDRNTGNVGISIMGNYHPPASQVPTKEAISSITKLGKYIKSTYDISVSSFYAHRDIGPTDCPGDELYKRMPELKRLIFKTGTPAPVASVYPDSALPTDVTTEFPSLKQLLEYIKR